MKLSPFRWGFARIGWESPGHWMYVEHAMPDRVMAEFALLFSAWLANEDTAASFDYVASPHDAPAWGGWIKVSGQGLLSWNAERLATAMDDMAAEATRKVDGQIALEQPMADEFLRVLHERGYPGR